MELASRNINVQTVADEIMIIQSLVLAILSLFEGYLALGLLVGVAGIGVVTVRNVSERRTTIGMLRAIGFKQRHVLRMFSIEISWVAVLGMLNGLLVGYGFHVVLYNALWEVEGAAFSFPWASTGSSSPPVGSWCSSPPTFRSAGHRPFHLLQHYVLPENNLGKPRMTETGQKSRFVHLVGAVVRIPSKNVILGPFSRKS